MMNREFLMAWLLVFIVWMAGGLAIHGAQVKPWLGQGLRLGAAFLWRHRQG